MLFIEERLQDEGGRDLVDDAAVLLAGMAGLIENLVRFAGGKALVAEVDGQAGELAQRGGEDLGSGGLAAFVAREVQRIANHDACHTETPGEAGQGAEIVAGVAPALQGKDGVGRDAQFIRDGDTNAAIADVETEVPGLCSLLRFVTHAIQLIVPAAELLFASICTR